MEIIILINVYQWAPAALFSYFWVYLIQNNVLLILQTPFHIVNTLESQ